MQCPDAEVDRSILKDLKIVLQIQTGSTYTNILQWQFKAAGQTYDYEALRWPRCIRLLFWPSLDLQIF